MTERPRITHKLIDTPKQPWISSPYSLISWWDMEQFSAEAFYEIGKFLGKVGELFADDSGTSADRFSTVNHKGWLTEEIGWILEQCENLGLLVSARCASDLLARIELADTTIGKISSLSEQLGNTISFEMQTVLFFHLPSSQAEFYAKRELFGKEVTARFPNLQSDIEEAGNCLALGRSTACVFHLMRIMEAGTQAFGSLLGVTFTENKNWQNILDESNKAIKALPKGKDVVELSQIASNLYSVKVAWRNEVMHPKATYTADEAEDVLRQVKGFIKSIAKLNPPTVGSDLIQ